MKQITAEHCSKLRHLSAGSARDVRIPNIVFINAVLYLMENGCKWRILPKRLGYWFAVYARFRRWSQSGVLEQLFEAFPKQEAVGEEVVCFSLDSISVKVHPDGTGARKKNGPRSIGKSRGGWHAKIHMVSASDR